MRLRSDLQVKWLSVAVGELPLVDDRWALTITAELRIDFEPALGHAHRKMLIAAKDQQARATLAEWNVREVDSILKQFKKWRLKFCHLMLRSFGSSCAKHAVAAVQLRLELKGD